MPSIKFSERAYCKMILHTIKYPHCTVNGILLAKTDNSNKEIEFVDVIPFFHVCINLTPMAEIALMQVDEYASRKGMVIAGYYVAPENPRDDSFDSACNQISSKIATNHTPSYLVVVNSTMSTIQKGKIALRVAQNDGTTRKQCDDISVSDDAMNICISAIKNSLYEKLIDFDNHLDNISLDWTNSALNKKIQAFL